MKGKAFAAAIALMALAVFPFSGLAAEEKTWGGEPREKVLAEFSQIAESARKEWQVPGMAMAVVQGDKLIFARGCGVRRYGKEDLVPPEMLSQIGSISKSFTAALVTMEAGAKRLQWDDSVADHLPEFRIHDPWVTREFRVFDLMPQRSGLLARGYDFLVMTAKGREEILLSLEFIPPVTSFRSDFAYQNSLFPSPSVIPGQPKA